LRGVDVPCESSVEQGNDLDDLTSEIQANDHALVACRNFMFPSDVNMVLVLENFHFC